jgi:hypothetical protein
VALVAAWSFAVQGCYESLPLQQGPAPTVERVELVLNDQGRAALAERLGPMVGKVEGHVLSQDDGSYTIAVYHVRQLNGNSTTWNGEQVSVRREHTLGFQVRQLNRTRTAIAAGVATLATVVIFFGKELGIGGGGVEEPSSEPEAPPSAVRRRP